MLDMPDCGITVDSLPQAPEGMEIAGVEVIVRLRRRTGRPDPSDIATSRKGRAPGSRGAALSHVYGEAGTVPPATSS